MRTLLCLACVLLAAAAYGIVLLSFALSNDNHNHSSASLRTCNVEKYCPQPSSEYTCVRVAHEHHPTCLRSTPPLMGTTTTTTTTTTIGFTLPSPQFTNAAVLALSVVNGSTCDDAFAFFEQLSAQLAPDDVALFALGCSAK